MTLIIMPLVYVNYIKTSSHVEPFLTLTLKQLFQVSAKRWFTHTLDTVAFSLKMYPLKPPLWYFPWWAIFSKKSNWSCSCMLTSNSPEEPVQTKSYYLHSSKVYRQLETHHVSHFRKVRGREKWGRARPWLCFHLAYEREESKSSSSTIA